MSRLSSDAELLTRSRTDPEAIGVLPRVVDDADGSRLGIADLHPARSSSRPGPADSAPEPTPGGMRCLDPVALPGG